MWPAISESTTGDLLSMGLTTRESVRGTQGASARDASRHLCLIDHQPWSSAEGSAAIADAPSIACETGAAACSENMQFQLSTLPKRQETPGVHEIYCEATCTRLPDSPGGLGLHKIRGGEMIHHGRPSGILSASDALASTAQLPTRERVRLILDPWIL